MLRLRDCTEDGCMCWINYLHVSPSQAIGCTQANCLCDGFQPGKLNLRSCDRCTHGWVTHAVSKLGAGAVLGSGQVEMVQPPLVFDISSVLLYGTQAVPIRMKILLDRLYSVLTHTHVLTILHTLGWTLRDYIRGYMLQDSVGKVLDRWVTMTPEDEVMALQHFTRFGETKSIVELMVVQEQQGRLATISTATRADSDIRLFIESSSPHRRSQPRVGEGAHRLCAQAPPSLYHFEHLPGGNRDFLQLFQYSGTSTAPPLLPLSAFLQETSDEACGLRQPKQTKQNHGTNRREAEGTSPAQDRSGRAVQPDGELAYATSVSSDTLQGKNSPPVPCSSSSSSSPSVTWIRSPGSSVRRGRVSCGACRKTFYDKGTLKIHYNAVHLKIKHRCTVPGCGMVFSSLRSRNRHSTNPNPRLHGPALAALSSRVRLPLGADRLVQSILDTPHTPLNFPPVTTVVPSCQTVFSSSGPLDLMSQHLGVTKATSNTAVIDQHREKLCTCMRDSNGASEPKVVDMSPPTANQSRSITMTDTVPRKKSRKSTMPVKIKRETLCEHYCHDNRGHDHSDDEEDIEAAHHEGAGQQVYPINRPMTNLRLSQSPGTRRHGRNQSYGSRTRHQGDDGDVSVTSNNPARASWNPRCSPHVPLTPVISVSALDGEGNHGNGNNSSTEEVWTSEKKEGLTEERMKGGRYKQEEDNWRERERNERGERGQSLIKVKEEVCEDSYIYYNKHHVVDNTAAVDTVARMATGLSNLEKGFNTNSDQEEED
uniref:C2H2-type domain-containing protein n=1 Tax=Electrophorus electricus TaxID=8005 RepID=A0A4W4E201_ELEEL